MFTVHHRFTFSILSFLSWIRCFYLFLSNFILSWLGPEQVFWVDLVHPCSITFHIQTKSQLKVLLSDNPYHLVSLSADWVTLLLRLSETYKSFQSSVFPSSIHLRLCSREPTKSSMEHQGSMEVPSTHKSTIDRMKSSIRINKSQ